MNDVIQLLFRTFSDIHAAGCSELQQVALLLHVRGGTVATALATCAFLSSPRMLLTFNGSREHETCRVSLKKAKQSV